MKTKKTSKRLAKREGRSMSNYLETVILQSAKDADIPPDEVSVPTVVGRTRAEHD